MGGLFHKLRHPRRCYVVCTIPRSGSNLLTDGLRDTRRAGMPKQFFLPKAERAYGNELGINPSVDYAAYVRAIVNTKVTRNEVFGFKLMSWYLDDFLARLRDAHDFGNSTTNDMELLCSAFPGLRFVRIVRLHKLRQALSTARALQTGLWKVQKGKSILREPEFDVGAVQERLAGQVAPRVGGERSQAAHQPVGVARPTPQPPYRRPAVDHRGTLDDPDAERPA